MGSAMKGLNFLVVDDSLLNIKRLTGILTVLGHNVIRTAGTGAQAVLSYEAFNPDMVTMDITMPDMDGIEATQRIVKRFPDARIIMVTSHGQEKMVMDALEAGAKGYVLKPVREDKLKAMISRALG
jgi:two-component system chemotaxis response regulator CheY